LAVALLVRPLDLLGDAELHDLLRDRELLLLLLLVLRASGRDRRIFRGVSRRGAHLLQRGLRAGFGALLVGRDLLRQRIVLLRPAVNGAPRGGERRQIPDREPGPA